MKVKRIALGLMAFSGMLIAMPRGYAQPGWGYWGGHNEELVVKRLIPVLESAGKVARIYYHGACQSGGGMVTSILFPKVRVTTPFKGSKGLSAVREMFQNDSGVTVRAGGSRIIRITVGNVPREILQTKIPVLKLNGHYGVRQYNAFSAILAITSTAAMQRSMRRLNNNLISRIIDITIPEPAKGLPHLPPLMRNVTADEALDAIAKTFRVIVVYGVCKQASGALLFNVGDIDMAYQPAGS